jgi:hypothetical protein
MNLFDKLKIQSFGFVEEINVKYEPDDSSVNGLRITHVRAF